MSAKTPEPDVDDLNDDGGAMKLVKVAMKYLFSHVGLCVLVCAYCVGGAFLFMHIEGDEEEARLLAGLNRSQEIEVERAYLAKDLWKHKWSTTFNTTVHELLDAYHKNVTDAISNYGYSGTRINSTDEFTYGWSFPSALLFTVTIVTTIGFPSSSPCSHPRSSQLGPCSRPHAKGYGHVAPKTEVGQLVVIGYSLLGIPLMLMFLANIGDAMANFFRVAYGRGCCYFCWKKRQTNYELNRRNGKRVLKRGGGVRDESPTGKKAWMDDEKGSRDVSPDGLGKSRRPSLDSRLSHIDDVPDQVVEVVLLEIEDPEEEVINVPISLTLVIIAAYIFIGAVIFAAWNEWSWITGAYFSFVTLSTIGSPLSSSGQ